MKIIRATSAGFCFGVERAYTLVTETTGDNIQIVGELIHNPQVVAELADRSIRTVASVDEVTHGTAIVRAHGTSNIAKSAIASRAGRIIDASCPFVIRLHRAAEEFVHRGLPVVIIGRPDHPEMVGVVEDFPDIIVTTDPEDKRLKALAGQTIGLLVQTTETRTSLQTMHRTLAEQLGCTVEIVDTICSATTDRQAAVLELAERVEAIVVIGGRNSNNTKNLFELARARVPAVWIETEAELEADFFINYERVGVTAGASTPETRIQAVIDTLQAMTTKATSTQAEVA